MNIHESGEMYLETILILTKEKGSVRSIDVSEHMNFSKPSVSRAMSLLKEGKLVRIDDSGNIKLTAEGKRIAEKIYERHNVLSCFFMMLGVDEATATDDACKIEHDISDASFDALKEYMRTRIPKAEDN